MTLLSALGSYWNEYAPVETFMMSQPFLKCMKWDKVLSIIQKQPTFATQCFHKYSRGGGPLVSKVGYHPRKKIHVIRVVFQDQAMYARTSFRGAKTCKIGKKGVFGHTDKFWNGHDAQIKTNTCKNVYLGSIFIPEKYVFRVCFESPFTRMISSLKYKCPPPGNIQDFNFGSPSKLLICKVRSRGGGVWTWMRG